jgi:hypothetical protein
MREVFPHARHPRQIRQPQLAASGHGLHLPPLARRKLPSPQTITVQPITHNPMNLKNIITARLKELGLEKFTNLADEIEKEIAAEVEAKARKLVAAGFDRVCRRARKEAKKTI